MFKKIKRYLPAIFIYAIVIVALTFIITSKESEGEDTSESQVAGVEETRLGMDADLDGDGDLEHVKLNYDETESQVTSIAVYAGEELVGSTPEGITFPPPAVEPFKVFRLDSERSEDYFSFDFIAGPHQFERMFFGLYGDVVFPVCFKENPEGPEDCLFYMDGPDELVVEDLDKDGWVEVVEIAFEYPGTGELNTEEQDAIDAAFEEFGVSEFTEGAEGIAKREKGGKGRPVAWGIYSYNGVFFEPQEDADYEKYILILKEENENLMRKSELSEDSLEYIESTRNFWTKRN
jgi:hypothetical protein